MKIDVMLYIKFFRQFYTTKLLGTGNDLTGKFHWIQDGDERDAMLNRTQA